MRRSLLSLAPLLLLGSCSQYTELSATFIDGRLGFVAKRGTEVDCVQVLGVYDVDSDEVMWEVGDPGTGSCLAALPIRYGQAVPHVTQGAKPLRPGRRYEVSGGASGGNSLSGRFRIFRALAWRVEDVPDEPSPAIPPEDVLASENHTQ